LAVISLALIGGLAVACFVKAFGTIFLGNTRSTNTIYEKEDTLFMRGPMLVLATVCLWVGLFPRTMLSFSLEAASTVASFQVTPAMKEGILAPLTTAIRALFLLIGVVAILFGLKKFAMKYLPVEKADTWFCGYSAPTAHMQYTSASFAKPLLKIFGRVLGYRVQGNRPEGYFPVNEEISSKVTEASEDLFFRPIFQGIRYLCAKLKIIQQGYTQLYLLYILIFLLALLVWKMV
jgi:hypothetical protein